MSEPATEQKPETASQKAKTESKEAALEKQIAELEAKAKAKRKELADALKKSRERNARSIAELIKQEGLETYDAEIWRAALPSIRQALDKAKA